MFGSDMQIKQGEMTSISAGRQGRATDEVCMQSVKHKAYPHQHTQIPRRSSLDGNVSQLLKCFLS